MHFHILGLGPVGSLVAHHLRNTVPKQNPITLIHKSVSQAQHARSLGGVINVEHGGVIMTANGFKSEIFEASYGERAIRDKNRKRKKRRRLQRIILEDESSAKSQAQDDNSETIESLIVTTKAHTTLPAIERLIPRISPNCTIVLMQNGLGIYEHLISQVFRNPTHRPHFILASNSHGAWLKGFYNAVHTNVGSIEFGIAPDTLNRDFEAGLLEGSITLRERRLHLDDISHTNDPELPRYRSLRNTVEALCSMEALDASWKPIDEVQTILRRKIVVGTIINALTAVMGCRNGDIFNTEASKRIMRRVCHEAAAVYAAQLQAETNTWLNNTGEDAKTTPLGRVSRALTWHSLEAECLRTAEVTSGNISSMLSDVRRGKVTEVEFLNGYLLNLGSTHRIQMPATATLLNLVKMRTAIPLEQML